jgi:hypothetical protein
VWLGVYMVNNRKGKMKNKLGIEICCANCIIKNTMMLRQTFDCEYCRKKKYVFFNPYDEAYENRIKELQGQLEIYENAYHKSLDAYHDVAEQLEELKARSRQ